MGPTSRHRATAALSLVLLASAGCSGGGSAQRSSAQQSSTRPTIASSPAETPTPVAATPTGDAGLTVPPTTAGNLGAASVPGPPDLGAGWKRYADPGAPEEGYVGNGSWVRARGSAEVVQSVVPLGCAGLTRAPALPVPQHALEATYRGPSGQPAVALVLEYGRSSQASTFLAGMGRIARACATRPAKTGPSDPMSTVDTLVRVDGSTVLDIRREYGAGAGEWVWSEVIVRDGSRVGLLVVAGKRGATGPQLAALAAKVRRSIVR
ncbi:MAG: hypothetical protein QOJ90_1686 [Actinomycetota bacterium]|nr:hypothetical protein [Actinomycetota bacterium]MDQ1642335.1 hypothetical protein [Actinomycetota bacterium]